jgi:hypothetical protein
MSGTPVRRARARSAEDALVEPLPDGGPQGSNGALLEHDEPLETSAPRRGSRLPAVFRRVPTAVWICALVAFLNAFAWSLITPPFQGKDEVDHFAYIAQLAEKGALPSGSGAENEYSPEQQLTMEALHYYTVRFSPSNASLTTEAEQQELTRAVHAGASTVPAESGAGIATSEPPLYYALQTIPYFIAQGNILDQLQLMRVVGALFAAITALFTVLFLREVFPRSRWIATVVGLCVALQPLLGFISGSVNPDSMLYAVAAAVFYCLARAFRRGLTLRLGVALGLLTAIGFATKLNFVGLAAGVFVGIAIFALRGVKARGRRGLLAPGIAASIGVLPVIAYALKNAIASQPTLGLASGVAGQASHSLFDELSYVWQLYLPRIPGMPHYFVGIFTLKDVWFDRSVGLYGWMDTMFPTWVDNVALVLAVIVAALCVRGAVMQRDALRARLPELGVYALMLIGLLALIGVTSFSSDVISKEAAFGEPRYLLPLLPLFAAALVLAVRGAGRRWAPVVGAVLVMLFLGHDLFSQLQVVARYYG